MASFGEARYEGTVVSWSGASKWGFLSCPALAGHLGGKDIFFHVKDCDGTCITKGQTLSFVFDATGHGGKPQAKSVLGGAAPPDAPDAVRYTGTVASFSQAKAWGFISCPELSAVYGGKEIFFHAKDCGGQPVTNGHTVSFLMDDDATSRAGKPQAKSITVLGGAGGASETRYSGTVAGYSQGTAWGFIACPALAPNYNGKDIFFHNKDCTRGTMSKGCSATFTLDTTSDPSKPQARDIRVSGGGTSQQGSMMSIGNVNMQQLVAAVQAGMGGGGFGGMGGGFGGQGGDLAGFIQSFNASAGWGFIECPALGHAGGKGLFFHIKDVIGMSDQNPPSKGANVTFALSAGPGGKPQAVNVACGGGASPNNMGGMKRTAAAANMGGFNQQALLAMAQMNNLQHLASLGGGMNHHANKRPRNY
ncbi:unnamed protein product [Polarella glacialis]|uniref:CSD domain-containing protein n=1 Tax=Polarella glacialis TaxID=89957 RepID=A0A813GH41_POLGL|nr:unnamed protein product [Polarella glacialis]CAE8705237.1 unnamed protein product [Polarella glacialis]|eukprot:CAMPEP_0115080428 /NCGR_PEP_ID=MMETSP0227-20121206/18671_1 /TAXON_ID=89957 /ORGANISM="Polarella glacialis, Strain CCMP 1383" /LENGTH=418 /DNA_ID=CAMNT_0002468067 /DNA_START=49 /DNA_END=1305 /DNA_ORIENTATION=+